MRRQLYTGTALSASFPKLDPVLHSHSYKQDVVSGLQIMSQRYELAVFSLAREVQIGSFVSTQTIFRVKVNKLCTQMYSYCPLVDVGPLCCTHLYLGTFCSTHIVKSFIRNALLSVSNLVSKR